jgi:nucleoside-diphosphate-sugar epimerase
MDYFGIAGGVGFVGSALARHLSKSFKVKALDIKSVPIDLEPKVQYQSCDVRNFDEESPGLDCG